MNSSLPTEYLRKWTGAWQGAVRGVMNLSTRLSAAGLCLRSCNNHGCLRTSSQSGMQDLGPYAFLRPLWRLN